MKALLDAVRNRREERSAAVPGAREPEERDAGLERGGRQHELGPPLPLHRGLRRRDAWAPPTLAAISDETPFLIDISPARDRSFFTLAVEKAAGAHSGLDSTIKHLLSIGLIEDAPTLEGPWSRAPARRPGPQRPHPAQDGDPARRAASSR